MMISSRAIRIVIVLLVLICTAGCDQVTKHLARTELGQTGTVSLPGRFIEFSLAENPGAFLGLAASFPQVARSALTVCAGFGLILLLAFLIRTPRLQWIAFLGLALICAGEISNLIDRFARHGLVTDFVVVQIGPLHTGVFNLADFTIVAGMLMFVASLALARQRAKIH